ncbi:MAG: LacI family DNA-binding transcriptional regulator, partial [Cellulomonadaceae bacterium]
MGGRMTMAKLAAHLGVATSTVSRALSDAPGVSAEERERIQTAARELGYRVSPIASTLSRGRGRGQDASTGSVAVITRGLREWYQANVTAQIVSTMQRAGLSTIVYDLEGTGERHRFFDELPLAGRVDAALVVATTLSASELAVVDRLGLPLVGGGTYGPAHPHVAIHHPAEMERAVRPQPHQGPPRNALIQCV